MATAQRTARLRARARPRRAARLRHRRRLDRGARRPDRRSRTPSPGARADTDAGGLVCLPGIVDVHSDALEREARPRPTAELPWDFALLSLEAKLSAAGVTTVFHGAAFQKLSARGVERSARTALDICATVDARRGGRVDHRVLHRLDVRSPDGIDQLRQRLGERRGGGVPALVSHEDHTPGQASTSTGPRWSGISSAPTD